METGPIAAFERRISVQDSLLRYCYLQLTDTSRFREAKLYRGSNPLRSASKSELQRNSAVLSSEIREICPFLAIMLKQTGPQRTDRRTAKAAFVLAFLWRAAVQSGFEESRRGMQCDHNPGIQPQRS